MTTTQVATTIDPYQNYVMIGDTRYKFVRNKKSHPEALNDCKKNPDAYGLATPTTLEQYQKLASYVKSLQDIDAFWLGLVPYSEGGKLGVRNKETWSDVSYEVWGPSEPGSILNGKYIAINRNTGMWMAISDQTTLPYICQAKKGS